MKNRKNRAILAIFALTTIVQTYGMSDLIRNAINGTLAARLLRSTPGTKGTQRPTHNHKKKRIAKAYRQAKNK